MRKNDRGVILLCEAADRLDKTVWCYTELRGLICGTAKGAQSGKNRFGGSFFVCVLCHQKLPQIFMYQYF